MTIVKRIGEMGTVPRGYGVAWMEMCSASAVCLPIGLHIVVGIARAAYLKFKMWHVTDARERAWREGWSVGREHGYRHGQTVARLDYELSVQQAIRELRSSR